MTDAGKHTGVPVLFIYRDGRTLDDEMDSQVVAAPLVEQMELDSDKWLAKVTTFRRTSIENESPIIYEEYDWYFMDIDVPLAIEKIKALKL